jgi:hypothetical protein
MMNDAERQQIHDRTEREYCWSLAKHGNWDDETYLQMYKHTMDEFAEAHHAICVKDYFGEHGMFNEYAQVAACCEKAMVQILRREKQ